MIWIERVCYATGFALLLGYAGVRVWADQARAQGVAEVTARQAAPATAEQKAVDQTLWSQERVIAYERTGRGGRPEAVLRIPSLALEVPVYGDTSEINLNRGAGHIAGTAALEATGNIGIAAHRDGFFRKLKDAVIDSEIYLDFGNRSVRYRIVEIQIVAPEDGSVLAPTGVPSLTLVTCFPFYFVGNAPQRYVVRAELDDAHRLINQTHANPHQQRSPS